MSRCEYQDPNSPEPFLNCCDSYASSPAEFADSCTNRLGGKLFADGGCEVLNLPFLPKGSPGRWRGACLVIPSLNDNILADIVDTDSPAIYDAPSILGAERVEINGRPADKKPGDVESLSGARSGDGKLAGVKLSQ